jgi:hypothetical protein
VVESTLVESGGHSRLLTGGAAVGLAQDGRVTKKGMPKPLDLALFVSEFKDEVRGPGSPGWA